MIHLSYISKTSLLLLLVALGLAGCAQQQRRDSVKMQLTNISVHLVQTGRPYKFRNDKNEEKQVNTAYMVLFDLKDMPKYYGPNLDFYIGSYKVPEYGETPTGIYFRIYEPELLNKLNNQPVSYRMGRQQQQPLNKSFTVPGKANLKAENEDQLLKRGG